ncbi:prepilin peptidase [Cronobacter muytjensii]|nr:prepilin peptidase [Cronobacter muytjensii]
MITLWLLGYILLNAGLVRKDLRYGLLPNSLTCPLLWLGLSYHLIFQSRFLADAVAGALIGYLSLSLLYWAYRWLRNSEGLGYGDVKYLGALGAWHGWQMLGLLLLTAALLGLMMSFFLYRKKEPMHLRKTPLPFGPFLAAAGLLCSISTFQILDV